ncbi:MAG: DUF4105 domain-containing protein [Gammaproteobacteria bacterium]|nr:DUF4105 domain-containing protein [Gammaproteobacteria bacterium]MBV9723631.1 DUF4105 domain-containing protein [Gammaproteobacteria bacterium]
MAAETTSGRARTLVRRSARGAALFILLLAMLAVSGWGALALHYWDHANGTLRNVLAGLWSMACLALAGGFLVRRWRWRSFAAFVALSAVLITCWRLMTPSNDRNWEPENAVLAYATIDGDRITLHDIRNFDYRSERDFTPAYYDRVFDLRQLDRVDLFAVHWMGPAVAHVLLSFGFADGAHVAFSIETRREKGQSYSSLEGFFRQYTLYYAVGDERDIVRLRTNYRHAPPEQVYLYRLHGNLEAGRRLFLEYLAQINALRQHAQWYNTLTSNCTNSIWLMSRINPEHVPYSWKILLSGYLPEYLYEQGKLDRNVPFPELQRAALINARAQAADEAADFSQRIRVGSP